MARRAGYGNHFSRSDTNNSIQRAACNFLAGVFMLEYCEKKLRRLTVISKLMLKYREDTKQKEVAYFKQSNHNQQHKDKLKPS